MTKKKQTTNTDFEELTSLTALIEEPQKQGVIPKARPELGSGKKEENLNPNPKPKKPKPKQAKKTNTKKPASKKPRTQKRYTNATVGETSPKIMTSIIISEDVRDWLRIQSITTKQSMSQQIEELVKKEMKKAK